METEWAAAGTDMNGSILFGHACAERRETNLSLAVAEFIEFDEQRVSVIDAVPVGVVDNVSLHRGGDVFSCLFDALDHMVDIIYIDLCYPVLVTVGRIDSR